MLLKHNSYNIKHIYLYHAKSWSVPHKKKYHTGIMALHWRSFRLLISTLFADAIFTLRNIISTWNIRSMMPLAFYRIVPSTHPSASSWRASGPVSPLVNLLAHFLTWPSDWEEHRNDVSQHYSLLCKKYCLVSSLYL